MCKNGTLTIQKRELNILRRVRPHPTHPPGMPLRSALIMHHDIEFFFFKKNKTIKEIASYYCSKKIVKKGSFILRQQQV